MDQKIDFHVRLLADQATRQAKKLSANLGMLNRDFRTNIRMFLIDNATRKLQQIRTMLASFPSLFDFTSKTKTSLRQFGHAVSSIFKNDGSKEWFEKIVGYFKKAGKWAMHLGDSLVGAFSIGGAAITAGIGVASAILSKQLIKINSEMEQFEVSLQTTLGSLTAAKQEMAGIVQFAKETPYEIKGITDAVVKLRAYSMDSGKWLEPLGNAASAFGRDITDAVEMAADAVQGMFRRALSYGLKMDKEDFKRGGKYAGMTYAEALMMELEKRFKGGMELQAKTLKGIWSNVKDSLYIQFQETTKPLFAVIKQQIQSMYEYLGSNEGQAKIRQLVTVMTDMLSRILEGGKKAFSFFKTTLLPIVQTTGKAMLEVFGAISDMVTPLLTAAKPLVIALASVLTLLSKLVTSSKLALQIFVGFSVAIKVMKLLGLSVGKLATSMVASGRAANMLSASIKTLGAGAIAAGVSFAAMWAIGNYLEIKNNLKEIGNEIHNMANSADEVKTKLKEIGEETGHTVKEMSKAALAAKQFGHNMSNVIEASARATSKAQEGFGKNLEVDADKAAEAIGRLAAAFIEENDTFEEMERKTKDAENMLVNLNRVADITGITFDDMTVAIEDNRDTLAEYADNVGELTFLLAEFGKAAKQAGIDANVGQFLDVLGSLLHPTKEMLLSLPSSTWIAKPLKDMDIDSIAESLSESLDATDIKSALVRAEGTAVKLVDASQEVRDNIEAGADYAYDKMKETAALYSTPGGGAGSAPGTALGAGGKASNFFGTGAGTAVQLVGYAIAFVTSYAVLSKIMKKINSATGGIIGRVAQSMDEKALAKAVGKDFLPRLQKMQDLEIKNLEKLNKDVVRSLEKELSKTQKALDKLYLNTLKNPALRNAVPLGMSAEEFIQQMMDESPESIKKFTEKSYADFKEAEKALSEKIVAIEEKLSRVRLQAVESIERLNKSYDDLRDAFKKGKIPESMKELAESVRNLGNVARESAKKIVETGSWPTHRKIIPGALLQAMDYKRSVGLMGAPFQKGFNLNTIGQFMYGGQRTIANVKAAENPAKAYARTLTLSIGRLSGKLLGKLKRMLTGGTAGLFSDKLVNSIEDISKVDWSKVFDTGQFSYDMKVMVNENSKVWDRFAGKQRKIYRALYNESTNQFAKYSQFIPKEIQSQLEKMGATLTEPLERVFDRLLEQGVKFEFTSKTQDWLYDALEKKVRIPLKGVGAMGTNEGLISFWHEIGHAIEGLKIGYGKEKTATLTSEASAWRRATMILDEMKILPKVSTLLARHVIMAMGGYLGQFMSNISPNFKEELLKLVPSQLKEKIAGSTMTEMIEEDLNHLRTKIKNAKPISSTLLDEVKTFRQEAKILLESLKARRNVETPAQVIDAQVRDAQVRDAKGRFVKGNKYAFTSETAPRITTETNALIEDFVKADKAAANLTKSFSKLNKAVGVAMIVVLGNVISDALEGYLTKRASKGESINAYALQQTWEKMFGGIKGEIAEFVINIGFAADIAREVSTLMSAGLSFTSAITKVSTALGAVGIAATGVINVFKDLAEGSKKYGGVDTYRSSLFGQEYKVPTGDASIKSMSTNFVLQIGKLGEGILDGIRFLGDNIIGRLTSVYVGDLGKLPEEKNPLFSGRYGEANIVRQKEIEDEYNRTKDVGARELAYTLLKEEKINSVIEASAKNKEAVLSALNKRILEQFKILVDAGKGSTEELLKEEARAAKYVQDNIGAMTEFPIIDTIKDQSGNIVENIIDVSKNITEFENAAGSLYGKAVAVSIDEALSNYDFSSAEGFKKFMQDMELGNVPQAFKDFFEGMDGGQLALTLTIEQLRKMQTESDALGTEIEKLSDEIDAATNEIAELEEKLNRLEVATNSVTAAFELGIARNELVLTSDKVWDLEDSISELGRQLSKAESEMTPLENALKGLQDEFQAIQDEIDKTQEKIDRLMNGPIEGEKAYQEERYRLEKAMKEREHELEKIQRENRIWDEIPGLSDSDLAKRARVSEKNLEYIIQEYKDALADLEYGRWQDTADAEHKRNILKIGEEIPVEDIMTKLEPLIEEKKLQESLRDIKGEELANQQALVDAKADEIANIQAAMTLKEQELENIKAQVAEANKLNERTKARAAAEAEIERLKSQMIAIDALASKNALLQLAASGVASQEQLDELAKIYVDMVGEASALTNQKTLKGLELPSLQTEMANAQAQQTALIDKIGTLVEFIDAELIGGVNIAALSKTDLEAVFGANVGSIINGMAANLYAIAIASKEKAIDPTSEIVLREVLNEYGLKGPGTAALGNVFNSKGLTWIAEREPEAVIPLQNGSIPVKLLGNQPQDPSQSVVISNSFGDITIQVRNDKDLEEVKKAIIELKTGDTSFFSSPHQYLS